MLILWQCHNCIYSSLPILLLFLLSWPWLNTIKVCTIHTLYNLLYSAATFLIPTGYKILVANFFHKIKCLSAIHNVAFKLGCIYSNLYYDNLILFGGTESMTPYTVKVAVHACRAITTAALFSKIASKSVTLTNKSNYHLISLLIKLFSSAFFLVDNSIVEGEGN